MKQEVLIISDGQSNCRLNATTEAIRLHAVADVFGLMIGKQSDTGMKELSSFVSAPQNTHLFAIDKYQDLKRLVDLVEKNIKHQKCVHFDSYLP